MNEFDRRIWFRSIIQAKTTFEKDLACCLNDRFGDISLEFGWNNIGKHFFRPGSSDSCQGLRIAEVSGGSLRALAARRAAFVSEVCKASTGSLYGDRGAGGSEITKVS